MGDFFRIGAEPAFVAAWDSWLQSTLHSARAALGPRWEGCYMSAPIWRFSLAPGLAGPGLMVGVIMPSVDRVGRAFPLTLVMRGAGRDAMAAHQCHAATFDALEAIALSALDETVTRAKLAEAMAEVHPVTTAKVARDATRSVKRISVWSALNGDAAPYLRVFDGMPPAAQAGDFFDPIPSVDAAAAAPRCAQ